MTKTQIVVLALMGTIVVIATLLSEAKKDPYSIKYQPPIHNANTGQREAPSEAVDPCLMANITCNTVTVKATGFSSAECHTTWCNAHPTLTGHQVALNPKFGKHKAVFIPEFGKTYQIIGLTDQNTDLDIYHGSNGKAALAFGKQTLQVTFID